jgi:hypothetical protein
MPAAICPKCKSILTDYDHFFCSVCGTKLPKELIRDNIKVRVKTYKLSSATKSASADFLRVFKSIKTYYIVALLIFIGFVFLGISKTKIIDLARYELNKNPSIVNLPEVVEKKSPLVKLPELKSKSADFDTQKFSQVLPSDIAIYFEGKDIATISKYLVTDKSLSNLLGNPTLLLEDSFAGFYYKGDWGYLFVPKDINIVRKIMESENSTYWKFGWTRDMFVIASNESVFESIDKVDKGLISSLALNPEFVKKDQVLAKSGKVKLIVSGNAAFATIRESLAGVDQEMISYISKIITSGFDSIVVN